MNRNPIVLFLILAALMSSSCQLNPAARDKAVSHPFLCADYGGNMIRIVSAQGEIVWRIDENDLEGNPLRFVGNIQRLPNGHTVVCNWGGHGHIGQQPQIFEVTPDKKVVWQVYDYKKFNTISNIHVLDIKGDPTKGKILR